MSKLRVLAATSRTQGQRASDFSYCIPGELVVPCEICEADQRAGADGGCGCARAWVGLSSRLATTTAKVKVIPRFSLADLTVAIQASLEHSGMLALEDHPEHAAADLAWRLADLAKAFPKGAVLENRMGKIAARKKQKKKDRLGPLVCALPFQFGYIESSTALSFSRQGYFYARLRRSP